MKKRLIIAGMVLVIIIVLMSFLRYKNVSNNNSLQLSGTIEVTEANIGFKIPGRIQNLYAEEGQTVSQGEKLATLDNAELESMVNQGSASVRNAEAQFEKAQKDHERYQTLYRDGVIASQQMDAAKTAFDVAASQLQLSRASLRTAEVRFRDAVIYSPLHGVVLKKQMEQGETAGSGSVVYTIGDLEKPWVKVYVKENKMGLVKLDQKAEVTVDSFPNKRYEGVVTSIASEAEFTPKNVQTKEERVKLVFGVKVSVTNQNNELKPGMPADVKILLQ